MLEQNSAITEADLEVICPAKADLALVKVCCRGLFLKFQSPLLQSILIIITSYQRASCAIMRTSRSSIGHGMNLIPLTTATQAYLASGDSISIYCVDEQPIFFSAKPPGPPHHITLHQINQCFSIGFLNEIIVPTLYALWQMTTPLPTFVTSLLVDIHKVIVSQCPSPDDYVLGKLRNGAELMMPGVCKVCPLVQSHFFAKPCSLELDHKVLEHSRRAH